ncbi:hypothetical protein [Sphingopyxis alaskensis]|uniref:hypothetical protein n=1 Tax=Sphingopyxis alaskensis TaxID=117207 RepID=UPI00129B4AC6|nr:hypothetical protein [Sphingopyxis alaskensis]MCM3418816.1 hypothetical protein [Sphingopyxis alaskensis]
MTGNLSIYGFGSFCNGKARPCDIDLLLEHRPTDFASSKFAIDCKAQIKPALPSADSVRLSQAEAERLDFLGRAKVVMLEALNAAIIDADVQALASRLSRY